MDRYKKIIDSYLEKADKWGLLVIEREARKILRSSHKYKEFIMAMGSWDFINQDGKLINHKKDETLKPFAYFISRYSELKWEGEPMRFTANGPKITNW